MRSAAREVDAPPEARITKHILIIDGHPLVRRGLRSLIVGTPGLSVCGEASTPEAGLDAVASSRPDLVIVEPCLEGGKGLEMLMAILSRREGLPLLVLSMLDGPRYVERALRAGARGYVTKQEMGDVVLEAIHELLSGQQYVSPRLRGGG